MTANLCGGVPASFAMIDTVPMPPATETYFPISHGDFVKRVADEIQAQGLDLQAAEYRLSKSGAQMVAVLQCRGLVHNDDTAPAFALRSSHDKSMSKGIAGGGIVGACCNGMFAGDDFIALRKHTLNVSRDLDGIIAEAVAKSTASQDKLTAQIGQLKAHGLTTDQGYGILGRALGNRLITPTQATTAFAEWRKPRHEAFADRNAWSLYNAGTEALKLGAVRGTITRHTRWHGHMLAEATA